jgi:hypothetical protein
MRGTRILCGFSALGLGVLLLQTSTAQSAAAACTKRVVQIGPVYGTGCWHRAGATWVSPMPVSLDGLRLAGPGSFVENETAGTYASTKSVRWLLGPVQLRRAKFAWKVRTPAMHFTANGSLRGLAFGGDAKLAFNGSDGGTATLAATFKLPKVAGVRVSGNGTLRASRRHPFKVQQVHVAVSSLPLARFVFKNLEFGFASGIWSAGADVDFPTFDLQRHTLGATVQIENGALRDLQLRASSLNIPLGEGLFLTEVDGGMNFASSTIGASAHATYGPPIAGHGALQLAGTVTYESGSPSRWTAAGDVSLPFPSSPTISARLDLEPGHAMAFSGHADLTFAGVGATGDLRGFAGRKAFNIEGDGSIKVFGHGLSGTALLSSKGMSACGKIKLLFKSFTFGFGYPWGGSAHVMGSSCDVGKFRVVALADRKLIAAGPTTIETHSPVGFAVFAAQGGDFTVLNPVGQTFTSAPDSDTPTQFSAHDPSTNTTYLAIPVATTGDLPYVVTPLPGNTLTGLQVADGLGLPTVGGTVTGTGANSVLHYTIGDLDPDETVSFYQGIAPDIPGAEPIVEDVTGSGDSPPFTPEEIGPATRYVFAVVSLAGVPRATFQVATFTASSYALPTGTVTMQPVPRTNAVGGSMYQVNLVPDPTTASWEILLQGDDGRAVYTDRNVGEKPFTFLTGTARRMTVTVQALDKFKRAGATYVCDTAKPGVCPSA